MSDYAARNRRRGTVVAISPWNFPLILSMYKVAYSLATGNTVVLKPSSDTPVIGLKIGKLFEQVGLPAGVLNVVTGPGKWIRLRQSRRSRVKGQTSLWSVSAIPRS